ncbi:hypothetical protein E2C01_042533 [Portunus trituberculatus]|uniref:Uncharacterized protein n=1 Tax=Portunus trituberculatus TaxID=210409 RepID=A0A5B7FM27_PORTR|nr:hypothetical protein [Portunus trituberculatus]
MWLWLTRQVVHDGVQCSIREKLNLSSAIRCRQVVGSHVLLVVLDQSSTAREFGHSAWIKGAPQHLSTSAHLGMALRFSDDAAVHTPPGALSYPLPGSCTLPPRAIRVTPPAALPQLSVRIEGVSETGAPNLTSAAEHRVCTLSLPGETFGVYPAPTGGTILPAHPSLLRKVF